MVSDVVKRVAPRNRLRWLVGVGITGLMVTCAVVSASGAGSSSFRANASYCGTTAAAFDGAAVGGYKGALAKCQVTCGAQTAHMCSAEELLRSEMLGVGPARPLTSAWYSSFVRADSNGFASMDCNGWTDDSQYGPAINADYNADVAIPQMMPCGETLQILCCD